MNDKPIKNKSLNKKNTVTLCEMIEKLYRMFLENGCNENTLQKEFTKDVKKIKSFFNLDSTFDVMIICHFVIIKLSSESNISIAQLVEKYKMDISNCLQLNYCLNGLIKRNILHSFSTGYKGENETKYKLSNRSLQAFLNNDIQYFQNKDGLGFLNGLLKEFDTLTANYYDNSDDFMEKVENIVDAYAETLEISWLKSKALSIENIAITLLAIKEHIFYSNTLSLQKAIEYVSEDEFDRYRIETEFNERNNELLKNGIVYFESAEFIGDKIKLTQDALDALCKDIKLKARDFKPQILSIINPSSLIDEVYEHQNEDLLLIEKMISEEGYNKISGKVKRMTIGITGKPGVGKTSFINHLAKKTNRTICSANIASILSCFVGESESKLIQLFREIDILNKNAKNGPCILVLDEVEAMFYKRNASPNSSVSQMQNNLISLILQELDKFNGILMCCSNFKFEMFDDAIKRRMHKIVELSAPGKETLVKILQNYFPEISIENAKEFIDMNEKITPANIKHLRSNVDVALIFEEKVDVWETLLSITKKEFNEVKKERIGFIK